MKVRTETRRLRSWHQLTRLYPSMPIIDFSPRGNPTPVNQVSQVGEMVSLNPFWTTASGRQQ
jgi:hypothetical protein